MIGFYKDVFSVFGMGDPENEDTKITTLGISATIMILYNMIGWPYIHELTKDKLTIEKLKEDIQRAYAIVNQVDLICDFCTGIMTMVKNLSTGD